MLGKNILGSGFDFDIELRLGAGAFVCGEETALIHSIEGKRGMPRPRPPYPTAVRACGASRRSSTTSRRWPTSRSIILDGAGLVRARIGTEKSKGTKVFALAGKVNNTGLIEVPMGTTLREVVYDVGGGIKDGKKFKAVQTGGPAGGCLPESALDTPVDYESLAAAGSIMGSGGMIVMDEDTCMVDVARFFLEFTQDESCGKCTPCREGTKRMLEILERITDGQGRGRRRREAAAPGRHGQEGLALRPGAGGAEPGAQHDQAFPRRVRRAHPREALPGRRLRGAGRPTRSIPEKCVGCTRLRAQVPGAVHRRRAEEDARDRPGALHQVRPVLRRCASSTP